MKPTLLLALTMLAVTGLTEEAKSQERKEIKRTIVITDGDTIINGIKLRDASPAERKSLLKELDETDTRIKERKIIRKGKNGKPEKEGKEIIIRRGDREPRVLRWRDEDGGGINLEFKNGDPRVLRFDSDSLVMNFGNDSLMKGFRFKLDGLDSNLRKGVIAMNRNFNHFPKWIDGTRPELFMDEPGVFERRAFRRENSQVFNYENTDKDGITSRMSIRISVANEETLKKMNVDAKTKAPLEVSDLNLSPNFSSGKLNLSFSLPDKGAMEVKILDSSLKELFTDKPAINSGMYFKQVTLPKNGVYYIRINQGTKVFVRKMVKE